MWFTSESARRRCSICSLITKSDNAVVFLLLNFTRVLLAKGVRVFSWRRSTREWRRAIQEAAERVIRLDFAAVRRK